MGDKVFGQIQNGRGLFYLPGQGIWKRGKFSFEADMKGYHMIDNVMYCCVASGLVLWCEAEELEWREPDTEGIEWNVVMGLESLRDVLSASKLVNYGEQISDFWESDHIEDELHGHKLSNSGHNMLLYWDVLSPESLEIWCAEISLERCEYTGEIWGNIEWSQPLLTLDPPPPNHQHCKILYSLSLNL